MRKFLGWVMAASVMAALFLACTAMAQDTKPVGQPVEPGSAYRTVGLGVAAALTIALSVLGAGHAVGRIGSAALGAAAEKPELLTRSLLFVALAEGLAVLGFAIAMLLVQKI